MPGQSETEVEEEVEVKDQSMINFEKIPINLEVQRSAKSSEADELVTTPLTRDIRSSLRCRLCAVPNNDMVDIFSFYEVEENIPEKIEYCLRIVVKETDTLPKHACRSCLEELELCYQFNKIVTEAEEQLLALDTQTTGKLGKTKTSFQTPSLCNVHCATRDPHNIESRLQTSSDVELKHESSTIAEEAQITDITVESKAASPNLTPSSEASAPAKLHCANKLTKDKRKKSRVDKRRDIDSSTDDLISAKKSAFQSIRESTCGSEASRVTRSRSRAEQKNIASTRCEEGFEDQENVAINGRARTRITRFRSNSGLPTDTARKRNKFDELATGKGLDSFEYEKKSTNREKRNGHQSFHTSERPFGCSICKKTFSMPWRVRQHASVHSLEKNHHCHLCNKSYKSLERKRLHVQLHMDGRLWECDKCKKTYNRKHVLRKHLKYCDKQPTSTNNATVQRYSCTSCQKTFKALSSLYKHNRVYHGKELFRCKYCELKFIKRASRNQHQRIHREKQPYECSDCILTFKTAGTLNRHNRIHHAEQLFSCEYCELTFIKKTSRDNHRHIHTTKQPYECAACNITFISPTSLKRHGALVHSIKPKIYHCTVCDRSYKSTSGRNRHMAVHASEKLWQCD